MRSKTGWKESLTHCFKWLNNDATDVIKNLDVPIFAINSDQHPTEASVFRKYSPLYKVRIIQGVNHVVFWEAPEIFTRYLDEFVHDLYMLDHEKFYNGL